ncbi:uncharacterized protein [Blastocystis hominis]|uniref:Uncharacterized protein n=1 Tax=Blastocystis hominis TaxID=12968 RepID=D8LXJ1_BLAHO|nr:uncharacterized protein [Blastocystis hominis]CBK20986.2 unnamed protein product [Blastocystis hominis]|eukprot:XP_012895034.1 uncharacterized protein [Blastocystis hominis]
MELFSCILADWDISLFYNLESIEIGDNCFKSVKTFKINGLDRLETIKIAENSFTQVTNQYVIFELDKAVPAAYRADKSFSITSCPSLKSIVIERYCFADFAGSFELKELPSLTSLKIGVCDTDTCCFLWNSFVIENLPQLEEIELGRWAFSLSLSTKINNLPQLKVLKLGWGAISGSYQSETSKLEMRNLPSLHSITLYGDDNFCDVKELVLENIMNVQNVNIIKDQNSSLFNNLKRISITNVSSKLTDLFKHDKHFQ